MLIKNSIYTAIVLAIFPSAMMSCATSGNNRETAEAPSRKIASAHGNVVISPGETIRIAETEVSCANSGSSRDREKVLFSETGIDCLDSQLETWKQARPGTGGTMEVSYLLDFANACKRKFNRDVCTEVGRTTDIYCTGRLLGFWTDINSGMVYRPFPADGQKEINKACVIIEYSCPAGSKQLPY